MHGSGSTHWPTGGAPSLRSDGDDLTARQPGVGIVVVERSIRDQAGAECVLPSSMLLSMIVARVHSALGPQPDVRLADHRDSASP